MSSSASAQQLPPPTAATGLLAWLLVALQPMNRTRVKEVLRSGRVEVNGLSMTQHDHQLNPGDRVRITRDPPAAPDPKVAGLTVIHEDSEVIAIDKPSGLLSVSSGDGDKSDTAFARLTASLDKRRAGRVFVVHRIDRDTSGVLLFARTPESRDRLQSNWETVKKTYLAVTIGTPEPAEGVIENFLTEGADMRVRASRFETPDAKRAISRYRVTGGRGRFALVEVVIETGRKHQIRVHMAGVGCPVIGDKMYGAKLDPAERLGLHAWQLAFDHPITGKRIEVESPFPKGLRKLVVR
jgi:23S rRNA pseudouridine1911/1915/1917 synthase